MPDESGRTPLVIDIQGRRSLLKPPFSERLRSGSVTLAPGEAVGAHRTEGREEALVVLKGRATLICEGEQFSVHAGQLAYVPRDCEHNVINESEDVVDYVYLVTPVGPGGDEHEHGGVAHTH